MNRVEISDRLTKARNRYLKATSHIASERSHIFTEYWKESEGEPIAIRRAKAFYKILHQIPISIQDQELIAGSQTKYIRGGYLYPEFNAEWQDELRLLPTRESSKFAIEPEDLRIILEDMEYWAGRSMQAHAYSLWKERWGDLVEKGMKARLTIDLRAVPQGRQAVDYPKVLRSGLKGIMGEAESKCRNSSENAKKRSFWNSAIIACQAVANFAHRYAKLAQTMACEEKDLIRREELERIAEICQWVPMNPARSFYEALQSFWLVHLALEIENNSWGYSPGRFDQYMYPYYKKDLEEGRLTKEEAFELLGCLWIKFSEMELVQNITNAHITQGSLYQNITIAGQKEDGKDATNKLSYLILDVTRALKLPQPTISVRYFNGLKEEFLLKAAELNSTGGGMPAWFNDNYAMVTLPYYGVPLREARNYAPIGCVEMGIPASSALLLGTGFVSLPKCLELTLHDGIDPFTSFRLGPSSGNPEEFMHFSEFSEAFKRQVDFATEWIIDASIRSLDALAPDFVPVPFNSALMNDCIELGKDITEGGARYRNFFACFAIGFITTANSLIAIKKVVFEDKKIGIRELMDALKRNFEGKEEIRQVLLEAPKYGNDNDYADDMVKELFRFTNDTIVKHKNPWGDPMAPAYLGITAHYFHGAGVGATPDGRKAYTPFADGSLSAYPGTDKNGPTAVIKSATKADTIPALATLFNLKFHPIALKGRDSLKKLLALIKTYFDLYGWHIQFNVIDQQTLLDAKKNPDNYRDLLVRVAGFSVYFVELAPSIQDEIISRTEHAF